VAHRVVDGRGSSESLLHGSAVDLRAVGVRPCYLHETARRVAGADIEITIRLHRSWDSPARCTCDNEGGSGTLGVASGGSRLVIHP
jgi:hypothetical protein